MTVPDELLADNSAYPAAFDKGGRPLFGPKKVVRGFVYEVDRPTAGSFAPVTGSSRSLVHPAGPGEPPPRAGLRAPAPGTPCGRGGSARPGPATAALAGTIAGRLRSGLRLLREPATDPVRRTSVLAWATPDYDVWLLRWPRGTRVDPHDHGHSAAAFSVVSGELMEVRWGRGEATCRKVKSPEVVTVEPGVVHDVVGATASALSVHVYSPPLSAMGFYDPTGTRLLRVEAVEHHATPDGDVVAGGRPERNGGPPAPLPS
jgi:quercetin dioxygenase-like cupin family protein